MISPLDPASLSFLNALDQIQRRSQRAQNELTTGLRIGQVSDDPTQIAQLLETRSQISQTQQTQSNLNNVKAEVDMGETSLASAVSLVEKAQTLGTQGQPSSMSADSRTELASELGTVLQQLVALSNTAVNGRYIFSGDSDQTAAYAIDLTKAPPIGPYQGSASTRRVAHPDGTMIPVAKTAKDIFDSTDPTQSVFQSIENLRSALLNNDQAGIDAALPTLKSADTYLNQQLSFYGVAQNRIDDGLSAAATKITTLQTQLSGIQDADESQAITEFQQAATQQQAALASRAKAPHTSLFDFLG